MKKNSFLKALLILFLVYVVLSWIIPIGYINNGELVSESTNPVGIFDLLIYPVVTATSSVFILTAIVILLIGGLYGVLNKTVAYSNIVEGLAKKFKGKEKNVLIGITVIFALLASLTGLTLPLLILVPFAAAVLMVLGYNKFDSMVATIGGILVGNLGSTYGMNVAGYVSYLTEKINDSIIYRIILLVLSLAVLLFILVKTAKVNKGKNKEENIPLYEKNAKKSVSSKGLVITSIISLIILFVGMINWNGLFGIELFDNVHKSIIEFKIGGYTLFGKLIGTLPAIGAWTNYEVAIILIIVTFIIGKLYKLSFDEIIEAMADGIKKMAPVAAATIIANIIFLLMNSNPDGYTIFALICNFILNLADGLNAITVGLASLVGSIFFNDFPYLLSAMYAPITSLYNTYSMIGIIAQSVHGLVQLIAPTSAILVAGLIYFDVDYIEWLKKLWKLFLGLLVVIVIVVIIMLMFV